MKSLKGIIQNLFGPEKEEPKKEEPKKEEPSDNDGLKQAYSEIRLSQAEKNEKMRSIINAAAERRKKERPILYRSSKRTTKYFDLKKAEEMRRFRERFGNLNGKPEESDEEKVLRILKGDFEKKFNISFDKFMEVYNDILKNTPEKLI